VAHTEENLFKQAQLCTC